MANVAAALLPVLVFLAVLYTMDGFKLVPTRWVLLTLLTGGATALLSLWVWSLLGLNAQAGPGGESTTTRRSSRNRSRRPFSCA